MIGNRWSRKEFLYTVAGGGLALLVGCGDDEPAGDGDTTGSGGDGGSDPSSSSNGAAGPSSSSGDVASSSGSGSGGGATGSGGGGGGGSVGCAASIVAAISNNHGHALEIPLADIEAGVEKTYSAQGSATHCHEVVVTAEDFATLQQGGPVTKFSCNGGDHEYVLSCAPDAPAPGVPDCAATPNFGSC